MTNNTKIEDLKPMMADREIEIIDEILDELQPEYCLEWGSGMSTVYFPTKHKSIKSWLAVEHNGHYLDFIQDKVPDNVQTLWVLPGSSYSDIVQRSNKKFDFIFVDGLDRPKCIQNGVKLLSDNGIMLLHDAGRRDYKGIVEEYGGELIIDGEKPAVGGGYAHRGIALFRKVS